jgi:uncharacterized repeat protein (TIGR03803 family)
VRAIRSAMRGVSLTLAIWPSVYGQSLTTLFTFGPGTGGGSQPQSGVVIGPQGQIYGTTPLGGTDGIGLVYELLPPQSTGGVWADVVLHSFGSQGTAAYPALGLTLGPGGVLYGVTGLNATYGDGTVFELSPPIPPESGWHLQILYDFTGASGGAQNPSGSLALGGDGALYGVTSMGGAAQGGTVFRLAPPSTAGGVWTEQILYSFGGYAGDGTSPIGSLAIGSGLTLYGALSAGGAFQGGAIFKLAPPASPGGAWTETLIYSFTGQDGDGYTPAAGLTRGPNGELYGTTRQGGRTGIPSCKAGCGTVFELDPPSSPAGPWTETILHAFTGVSTSDGSEPNSTLAIGPDGELYGTTLTGGAQAEHGLRGTIFELVHPSARSGAWTELLLHRFTGPDGWAPNGVALGPNGALYGTTLAGGTTDRGIAFELVP